MTRRFSESQFRTAPTGPQAGACPTGFVACPVTPPSPAALQMWQAMYQFAFAQAIARAIEDAQPTKYQRLLWRVSGN
jgi:hypothetical protein